jgi:diacylglycerol kinase family enzyme
LPARKAYRRAFLAGFLLINPHSGRRRPDADELAEAASSRGIRPHVLRADEDAAAVAHAAEADVLGVAGGDGSLAHVADACIERDLPFVCVPFGTRNHFARDLGLDRHDPFAALASYGGVERRIDVGRAGDRLFLNNVSFGAYAFLVHGRQEHRRRRDALARVRALLRTIRHPYRLRLEANGQVLRARVVLVANNSYELNVFDLGARENLTGGRLHLYSARGILPTTWEEEVAATFELTGAGVRRAAIDGEPVRLEAPLVCRIELRALRVLVPPGS